MEKQGLKPDRETYYKEIGQKFPGKLSDLEKKEVLSASIGFVGLLLEEKKEKEPMVALSLTDQNNMVQDYIKYTILGRLLRLSSSAEDNELNTAESINIYDKFKAEMGNKFSIQKSKVNKSSFRMFFEELVESYLDDNFSRWEIENNMRVIRMVAGEVIPDNPPFERKESSIKHTLD